MDSTIMPCVFDGRSDVYTWIERFNICAAAQGWDLTSRAVKLPVFLQGEALNVYRELNADEKLSAEKILAALVTAFTPVDAGGAFLREFERRVWRDGESPRNFLFELRQLLRRAIPDLDKKAEESLLYQRFLIGLPMDIANDIRTAPNCNTAAAAAERARVLLAHRPPTTPISLAAATAIEGNAEKPIPQALESRLAQVEMSLQQLHLSTVSFSDTELRGNSVPVFGAAGSERRLRGPFARRRIFGDPPRQRIRCYACSGFDHVMRDCAKRRQYSDANLRATQTGCRQVCPSHVTCPQPQFDVLLCGLATCRQYGSAQVTVDINGVPASALLDSGSSVSLVTSRTVAQSRQRPRPLQHITLRTASNETFQAGYACTLNFLIDGRRVQHDFLVVDELVADLILGVDFLSAKRVRLDFALSPVGIPLVKLQWESFTSELPVDRTVRHASNHATSRADCYCAAAEVDAAEELIAESAVPCFDSSVELVLPTCTPVSRVLK